MFASKVDTIPQMFRRRVQASGDHECYRTKNDGVWHSTSWREFADSSEAVAASLLDSGINRGDRVAILGSTQPPWCIAELQLQLQQVAIT